jgi:hypothetical protein
MPEAKNFIRQQVAAEEGDAFNAEAQRRKEGQGVIPLPFIPLPSPGSLPDKIRCDFNPNLFVSTKAVGSGLAVVGLVISGRVARAVFEMNGAELAGFDSWAVAAVDALENTLCSKVQSREFQSKNISGR